MGKKHVFKKLDTVLYNVDLRINVLEVIANILPLIWDHHPIIVMLPEDITHPPNSSFKFEAA